MGSRPPAPGQRLRARIEPGRQLQRLPSPRRREALQAVVEHRLGAVGAQFLDRATHAEGEVAVQACALGRGQGHVEHEQLALPRGLQRDLVAQGRTAPLQRLLAGAEGAAALAAPDGTVVIPQHLAAPVALVRARRRAGVEADAEGRAVVDQQIGQAARTHVVADAGALLGLSRRAPQGAAQPRQEEECRQAQRQSGEQQQARSGQVAPREGESRLRVLIALQGAQGGEGRHQSQRHQQGAGQALVEQQGSHQQEAGESDRAARVARPLALAEFEHEHAGRQGAARIATEQVAVLGDDGQGQGQGQRQAHPPGKPAPIRSQAALQPAHRQQGKHGQVQPDRQVGHVHGHGTGHRQSQQVEGMAVQARHSRASSRRQACRWWGPRSGPRRHDGRCRA